MHKEIIHVKSEYKPVKCVPGRSGSAQFHQSRQRLQVTQPGVSQQIQALEEHFGQTLFLRIGNPLSGARSTAAHRMFYLPGPEYSPAGNRCPKRFLGIDHRREKAGGAN
jgi:hypothetical protein